MHIHVRIHANCNITERVKTKQTFIQHNLKINGVRLMIFGTFVLQNVFKRIYIYIYYFLYILHKYKIMRIREKKKHE